MRIDDELIERYLLGAEIDPEKSRLLENLYSSDLDVMERLQLIEDQLIERYIRGELHPDDVRRFEQHFLASPRNQERLVFFRHLSRWTQAQNPGNSGGFRAFAKARAFTLLAASIALCVIPSFWLIVQRSQLRADLGALQASSSALRAEFQAQADFTRKLAEQLRDEQAARRRLEAEQAIRLGARPEAGNLAGGVLSFLLMPPPAQAQTRGEENLEAPRHLISRTVRDLQLNLVLPAAAVAKFYIFSIDTPDGTQIWSGGPAAPFSGNPLPLVRVSVPAAVIGNDDYVVNLRSVGGDHELETVATYSFRTLVSR
jgi:hypothetical protein